MDLPLSLDGMAWAHIRAERLGSVGDYDEQCTNDVSIDEEIMGADYEQQDSAEHIHRIYW